jgi:mannosyl-oligosaccharide alpha-1,2-mannosidase
MILLVSASTRIGKQTISALRDEPQQLLISHSWILAADSTIANLASHPSSRPDLTYLASYNHTSLILESGHLACFDGGNFILGGLVLEEQKYIDFGLELVASCENTYNQTLTGIGPEGFAWDDSEVPANQTEFYKRAGFYITSGAYILRPEVLESFYYAYRATGDRKYQDVSFRLAQHKLFQMRNYSTDIPNPVVFRGL